MENAVRNEFLAAMSSMGYKISEADPCIYYKWKEKRLSFYLLVLKKLSRKQTKM
jgi:hypothetical protein